MPKATAHHRDLQEYSGRIPSPEKETVLTTASSPVRLCWAGGRTGRRGVWERPGLLLMRLPGGKTND